MWFKQAKLLQLSAPVPYDAAQLAAQLAHLPFHPCSPHLPHSAGWVSPLAGAEDDTQLVHAANGYLLICLQLEEKLLPNVVVNQTLQERIKELELQYAKKISGKAKQSLKADVRQMLLPRAFSKLLRIYAYIDTKRQWLIVDNITPLKLDLFVDLLQKTLQLRCNNLPTKALAPLLTSWLRHEPPGAFNLEKNCVLQDPHLQNRKVRCQQQDLNAASLQVLLDDNYHVQQLACNWQDTINATIADDFTLRSIRYHDKLLTLAEENHTESMQQQLDANFFIMSETLTELWQALVALFVNATPPSVNTTAVTEALATV